MWPAGGHVPPIVAPSAAFLPSCGKRHERPIKIVRNRRWRSSQNSLDCQSATHLTMFTREPFRTRPPQSMDTACNTSGTDKHTVPHTGEAYRRSTVCFSVLVTHIRNIGMISDTSVPGMDDSVICISHCWLVTVTVTQLARVY